MSKRVAIAVVLLVAATAAGAMRSRWGDDPGDWRTDYVEASELAPALRALESQGYEVRFLLPAVEHQEVSCVSCTWHLGPDGEAHQVCQDPPVCTQTGISAVVTYMVAFR